MWCAAEHATVSTYLFQDLNAPHQITLTEQAAQKGQEHVFCVQRELTESKMLGLKCLNKFYISAHGTRCNKKTSVYTDQQLKTWHSCMNVP